MRILYLLKHFPALSQTFILNEITSLIDEGHDVSIIAMYNLNENKIHEKIERYNLLKEIHYLKYYPFFLNKFENNYSKEEIFERATKKLFEKNSISKEIKFNLLDLGYKQEKEIERTFRKFLDYLDILEIIKEKDIEHIHVHFADKNAQVVYDINKIINVPYTLTTHAYDIFVNPYKDLKKWADNAKKMIVISEYNKKYMVKNFGIDEDKISMVRCGINLDEFKLLNIEKENRFTILNIGRLNLIKNQKCLIEACKILKNKGLNFQCLIIGKGKERANLEKQIQESGLKDYIKLLGSKKNEELIEYYNKANVFVLPSISEASPTVIKEALACGMPVIVSNVRGVPEIIKDGHNGFLIEPEKPEQIANKLMELIKKPDLIKKFKKNSRKIIEKEFDVKENIKKLIKIFKK